MGDCLPPAGPAVPPDAVAPVLPPPPADPPAAEAPRPVPAPPVDVRSAAIAWLALLATLYVLHWARALVIPLLLAVMFCYALAPVVDRLQRWHVPRMVGAGLLLIAAIGGTGTTVYALSDDATALIASLPTAAQKLQQSLRSARGMQPGTIDKVQQAATRLEQAAEESAAPPPTSRGVMRVQVERPRFNIKDYLWSGTLGLAGFAGQAVAVAFITYFMLAAGDAFRRKLVHIAGPGFGQKRITIEVLDDITLQMQRYLLVQVLISALVGLATGLACWVIGLERALVWGVAAGVLNMVPYLGSVLIAAGVMLVGLLQFGTPGPALLLGGISMLIHSITGNLVTPWLTGRANRMNPVVIFVGVLAFGWLWGIWGLLLGTPMLLVVKAVCDRVDSLKSIGELMSD